MGAPNFPVGTSYGYSNINYILAGMVVKSATGIHIAQHMQNYIFTPHQLNSIFYDTEQSETGEIAHRWHNGIDSDGISRISLNTAGGPSGSLFSTPSDIAKWYHLLMDNQLISENSFQQMINFGTPGNYGLGIKKIPFFEHETWGHDGSTLGYKSRTIYDPCMKTVVVSLANSDLSANDAITALLYKVLIDNLPACPGEISGTTAVCQGESSVTYSIPNIPNATSYAWTLPNGVIGTSETNTITVNFSNNAISGPIKVVGVNNYGESAEAKLDILVNVSPLTPTITQNGNILISDAINGNQWYNDNGPIDGETNQEFNVLAEGTYYVVSTNNGCSSPTSNSINISFSTIYETNNPNNVKLFPNPTNEMSTLIVEDKFISGELVLVDLFGKVVLKKTITEEKNIVEQQNLTNGVYFIRIEKNGEKLYQNKLIFK